MALSKKLRFEVFKRDSFTCQYCGRQAPDVILHVDHIDPLANGGSDELMNLITSCVDCNLGKSDRLLSDDAVIRKQKQQLDALQERREQLEMLLEWHKSLIDLDALAVKEAADFWTMLIPTSSVNDHGIQSLKVWLKKFGLNEVLEGMQDSVTGYVKYDEQNIPITETLQKAFSYIPNVCASKRKQQEKPYLKELYYIRAIARNRFSYFNNGWALTLLEQAYLAGVSMAELNDLAKTIPNWSSFKGTLEMWIKEHKEE